MERVKRYQINQKVHIGHVQANGGVLHITTYENDSDLVYHEGTVWAVWIRNKVADKSRDVSWNWHDSFPFPVSFQKHISMIQDKANAD